MRCEAGFSVQKITVLLGGHIKLKRFDLFRQENFKRKKSPFFTCTIDS